MEKGAPTRRSTVAATARDDGRGHTGEGSDGNRRDRGHREGSASKGGRRWQWRQGTVGALEKGAVVKRWGTRGVDDGNDGT